MTKGYFTQAGLDLTMATAQGGDKSMAALLSGAADIALIGNLLRGPSRGRDDEGT